MRSMILLVLLGGFSRPALSQEQPPLAGPEVRDDRPAQLEQGLTVMPGMAPSVGQQMGGVRQLPPDDVADLLRRLTTDEVDWTMRLTDRQQARLKEVREAHQAEVREHRRQHAERFRELREAAGYNAEPRVPDAEVEPEVMEARLALRALYQSGPTAADLQIKLYAELTGVQQDWVDDQIERLMNDRRRAQAEQRNRALLDRAPVDPETFFKDDGSVDMDALPEGLRRRLANVAPEHRAIRLRRILERLVRIQSAPKGEWAPATDKRSPAVDTVRVPRPED